MKRNNVLKLIVALVVLAGGVLGYSSLSGGNIGTLPVDSSSTVQQTSAGDASSIAEESFPPVEEEPIEEIDRILIENSWMYEPTPEKQLRNLPVVVKIGASKNEGAYFPARQISAPSTLYTAPVTQVIKGDIAVGQTIKIESYGGVVTYQQHMNAIGEAQREKRGYNRMPKAQLDRKVLIADDVYYELNPDKEYILMLEYDEKFNPDTYYVCFSGYSVFEVVSDTQAVNVITKEVYYY